MSACPHLQLVLVRDTHARLRCRHCHLTIKAADLPTRYCPECFETTHTKRYDFDEVVPVDSGIVYYRCETCGYDRNTMSAASGQRASCTVDRPSVIPCHDPYR